MSNAINGQLITHDSEGVIKRDYLYRVSIKALIYNDAGQILVLRILYIVMHLGQFRRSLERKRIGRMVRMPVLS